MGVKDGEVRMRRMVMPGREERWGLDEEDGEVWIWMRRMVRPGLER